MIIRCVKSFRSSFLPMLSVCIVLFALQAQALVAGDINQDGVLNSSDVQLVINAALGVDILPFESDIDLDNVVNAADVQLVINAVLGISIDDDSDGLSNAAEANLGTDPQLFDTDGDGIGDGDEVANGQDPLTANTGGTSSIIINEFVASNDNGLEDEDGDTEDWLELLNTGDTPVSLLGWALTDDPLLAAKWVFPDVSLEAGQYLVVFASGKDLKPTDGSNLHTNFGLGASGEYLALFDADGAPTSSVFDPGFPEQEADYSYGLHPSEDGFWYFDTPTPGKPNDQGNSYLGFVEKTSFSHKRGFYSTAITDLTITSDTEGATIRYTLDGTGPTLSNGMTFEQPITITATSSVRAAAFKELHVPSGIKTQTYLLVNTWPYLKTLPVMSIVGDEQEALYEPNGVMAIVGGAYVPDAMDTMQWVPDPIDDPNDYNNPMERGRDAERVVSLELIEKDVDDGDGFRVSCGIRVDGTDFQRRHYTRDDSPWYTCSEGMDGSSMVSTNKFSFKLYFRASYGDDELQYPLFGDSLVDDFDRLALRGGHNDCNPFIRDELVRRLLLDMGGVAAHGKLVNMFINGQWRGVYNPTERIDENFLRSWFDSSDGWDIIEQLDQEGGQVGAPDLREGDDVAWNELLSYVAANDLSDDLNFQWVGARLDLQAFIDYLILNLYCGNADWPVNNWLAARERSAEPEKSKFRFYVVEAERCFAPEKGSTFDSNGFQQFPFWRPGQVDGEGGGLGLNGEVGPVADLYRALKASQSFVQLFTERVNLHFGEGGALTETNVGTRFNELHDKLSPVMTAIQGGVDTYILDQWVPNRRAVILGQFATEGLSK